MAAANIKTSSIETEKISQIVAVQEISIPKIEKREIIAEKQNDTKNDMNEQHGLLQN